MEYESISDKKIAFFYITKKGENMLLAKLSPKAFIT